MLDSGGWRSSVVTPFLLIVDPPLQITDRVADASPEADVGNLAGCGGRLHCLRLRNPLNPEFLDSCVDVDSVDSRNTLAAVAGRSDFRVLFC